MQGTESDRADSLLEPLTRREREVLGWLAQGFSAPEIAQQLVLAVSSVKWHIQHLYGKLGVNSKREALNRAAALGLLDPPASSAAAPAVSAAVEPPPEEPPFKGLRHFDASDADLFFGREHLVAALVARLCQHPFLAVVGASGSGKSSVVRAGLIPALAQSEPLADGLRPPSGSADWSPYLLTPTAHPLEALAASLTRDTESLTAATTLADDLAREPRSLRLAAQRLLSAEASPRLLLVVDQFEEVFTLCRQEAERRAFIDNLLSAVEIDGPVVAVLTLRADFYAHCVPYPQLRAALEQHQAYIGPMDATELRRAIEAPAAHNGYDWESGLVDLILRDAGEGEEPGALPLLSHALLETWKRRRGRTLAFAGYREAGGVRGAIAHTAQGVYERLTPEQQVIARRIFLRLTELGEGTRDTRRRAALSELLPDAEHARPQRQATEAVLRALAAARLVTLTATTAEVAHEAVLQEWPALREWLNENREGLRLHRRLTEAAQFWEQSGRDPGELFRGTRLAQTVDWAAWSGQPDELSRLEREFLDASTDQLAREDAEREAARQRELEAAQALAEAERARAAEQTRAAARLRQRNRIVTGVGLLALALAALAGFFAVQANRNAFEAEQAVQLSHSRQLTLQISNLDKTQNDIALLLSLEALRLADAVDARGALLASLQAAVSSPRVLGDRSNPFSVLAVSPDGATVATGDSLGQIVFWDVANYEVDGKPISGQWSAVTDLAFSPDGRLLASNAFFYDGIILWDVAAHEALSGELLLPISGPHVSHGVAFSPDGRILATNFFGGIRRWNVETQEVLPDWHYPSRPLIGMLEFNPAGRTLAAVNTIVPGPTTDDPHDGLPLQYISIWDLDLGQPVATVFDPESSKSSSALGLLTYSHSGRWLAFLSAGSGGRISLLDTDTAQVRTPIVGLFSAVSLAFSPDDQLLAIGSADGTVHLWDMNTFLPVGPPLTLHNQAVTGVAFALGGQVLASASEDGTLVFTKLNERQSLGPALTGHTTWVNRVAFSPDGQKLIAGGNDGAILQWDAATLQPLGSPLAGTPLLAGLAFSPDGARLAVGGRGGALSLLDAVTDQPIGQPLTGHTGDITGLAFSPNGQLLASASADQTVRLWDAATGQPVGSPLTGHTGGVTAVAFSPDGKSLASGGRDRSLRLWDPATGAAVGEPLTGHTSYITGLAYSPDGTILASSSADGAIRLWDTASHAPVGQPLLGHVGSVLSVAFSPNGALLASGGADQAVRLWDVAAGRQLGQPFREHDSAVSSVAFSPDGAVLASGSNDTTVLLWDVSVTSWQARACAAAGRNLTLAEWNLYLPDEPYHATCADWPAGQ